MVMSGLGKRGEEAKYLVRERPMPERPPVGWGVYVRLGFSNLAIPVY